MAFIKSFAPPVFAGYLRHYKASTDLVILDIQKIDKVDNEHALITYNDGAKETVNVQRIESREKALELLKHYTREALVREDAFDKLGTFITPSQYARLRNYEIEQALLDLEDRFFAIDEICPFNGFSWYS